MHQRINEVSQKRSNMRCVGCITIDTYIYVFHHSNGDGNQVNESVIGKQIKVLNEAFGRTPFQFRIMEVKFEVDDLFYSQFLVNEKGEHSETPETLIQRFPRRGDYSTLNLYFGGIDMPFSFSFLPSPGGLNSVPWDGAYIFLGSVPKVYSMHQTGATTVHEVSCLLLRWKLLWKISKLMTCYLVR
jgi:hypothetical protein